MVEHVGLITTSYPLPGGEGQAAAGAFVADFAKALSHHVRVSVVAPAPVAALERDGELVVRHFRAPRLPLSLLSPLRPDHWPAIACTLRNGQRAVLELCREARVDHLLALWALPSGEWARVAGERHGIPYSTWALGSDIWSLGRIPGVRQRLVRVLAGARRRYADGFQLATQVEALGGGACEFLPSTRHLPVNGHRRFGKVPPYRLAFLGRWHVNKGIDLLLNSLRQLEENAWQWIEGLRIHGGGPLKDQVEAGVRDLAAMGRPVSVGGYLDRHQAASLLEWADFLVLPSRVESIPVVFSDALQADCGLICTPVGDLPRLFREQPPGVMAESIDAGALALALALALRTGPGEFAPALAAHRARFSVAGSVAGFMAQFASVAESRVAETG